MIFDKMTNIRQYAPVVKNLENALQAIESLTSYEVGRVEFDGGYFMVQKGETKPLQEGDFEAHKKYLDIQIVVEGMEEMAWADISDLKESVPYNEDKDKIMYAGDKKFILPVEQGMFYIVYPNDAHQPVGHTKEQHSFTKIVIKLPV